MATDLENLQTEYRAIQTKLIEMASSPQPSYSEKGRSVSWGELYNNLRARAEELRKIPGVVPTINSPPFEVISVAR